MGTLVWNTAAIAQTPRVITEEDIRVFCAKTPSQLAKEYIEPGPPYNLAAVHRLNYLHDPTTLPALKSAFAKAQDKDEGLFLAAAVVRLGDPDPQPFEFLAKRAERVLEMNLPFPSVVPPEGAPRPRIPGYTPEFFKRAKELGLDPNAAAEQAVYGEMPAVFAALAESRDRRAVPLLLRALESPNYMIVVQGARGLAHQGDKSFVQPIVRACERVGPEVAEAVAQALFYFNTSEAERERERFFKSRERFELWRDAAKSGRGLMSPFDGMNCK